jgi:hypothetical protein
MKPPPKEKELLELIQIQKPCQQAWVRMKGDDRVRYCDKCRLNVYNLSGMTRQEATRLVQSNEGHICVRFFRRSDGTVVTRDCSLVQKARLRVAALVAGLIALLPFSVKAGSALFSSPSMGDMSLPESGQSISEVTGKLPFGRNLTGDTEPTGFTMGAPAVISPTVVSPSPEEKR